MDEKAMDRPTKEMSPLSVSMLPRQQILERNGHEMDEKAMDRPTKATSSGTTIHFSIFSHHRLNPIRANGARERNISYIASP
jgi:hypothetical protein